MRYLVFFAVFSVIACIQAAPLAQDVQAEIDQADPRSVLSSSSHHIPDDDPLVSIFVDILHDGEGEYEPEPYEGEHGAETKQSPKEAMKKRVLAVDDEAEVPEDDDERDNRIGKLVNIHIGIDNRGNGNGDGLVNLPV